MNIDERLAIGKRIYRNEITIDDAMKLYNVSRAGANNWLYEYRNCCTFCMCDFAQFI